MINITIIWGTIVSIVKRHIAYSTSRERRTTNIGTSKIDKKRINLNMLQKSRNFRTYLSAALQNVPQVSAMSSTRIATLPLTSPTSTIDATSFAFLRSLWIRAKSTFSLSAIEVTLASQMAIRTMAEQASVEYQSMLSMHTFILRLMQLSN